MSQYDFNNYQRATPNDTWFQSQLIQNQPENQQYTIKNEVGGLLDENTLFNNNTQQFNEFINNTASATGNINNNSSSSQTNSSDKSSPSTILNNVPFTSNDINFLNNEIQKNDTTADHNLSEKELANRRKAQNRAAQRAFRERKELKLKELEDKLNKSEYDKSSLLKQLEELKKQNVVISTENKLLLQNGSNLVPLNNSNNELFSFPSSEFHQSQNLPKKEKLDNDNNGKTLTITQVWEYLNSKDDPNLEIDDIIQEIKGLEVCHEHGPGYPIDVIDRIISKHRG